MSITRRSVLQGVLVAAATASAGPIGAMTFPPHALVVYDSRLPQSLAFRSRHAGRAIDVAYENAHRWLALRRLRSGGRVAGLTSWSDLVQVRGLLEERGRRLRAETRCGELFYWEMA